jgi:hypothetical protein
MTDPEPPVDWDAARQRARLSATALWWGYFGLGGMATPLEFAAFLSGEVQPGDRDRGLLSQALNDRFIELGMDSPMPTPPRPPGS